MAFADLGPTWLVRSQIGSLFEGKIAFVRNRDRGAVGAASRMNTHPVVVRLGDRNGSRGPDSDRDGLSDVAERAIRTDPMQADSDGDTIPDGFEVFGTGTLPTERDSDGDGRSDAEELNLDDPSIYADTDGDGLLDGQEIASFSSDPNSIDSDGDGLGDDLEFVFGTRINDRASPTMDSDNDGEPDEFELANGHDPRNASSEDPDSDGDFVPDWLDADNLMMARVPGRRRGVVPAAPTNCNFNKQNV